MAGIRVVVVDPEKLVRKGIVALLSGQPGIEVVGEAGDGREALAVLDEEEADILVLELELPELNGFEVLRKLSRGERRCRTLAVSSNGGPEFVARAFRFGASGYLVKSADTEELLVAVKALQRGRRYLSPEVTHPFVDEFLTRRPRPEDPVEVLTPRQREVLQLVAEGSTNAEIAEKLHISVKTVETHRADLMERLDIHDVAGLVQYALRHGIASPQS